MKHKYLKNVTTLNLTSNRCNGCGKCTEVCPHSVLIIENGKALIINKNSCMECGACAKNCPMFAIDVRAGVGCAFAVIWGWFTGKEAACSCSSDSECC